MLRFSRRPILVSLAILLLAGCGGRSTTAPADPRQAAPPATPVEETAPAETPASATSEADAPIEEPGPLVLADHEEIAAAVEEPAFLEKPLSYWIEQAQREDEIDQPPQRVVEALTLALESPILEVRVDAIDALGDMGAAALPAAPALVAQIGHEVAWVRTAAMETLGNLGAAAVPALTAALDDPQPSVRIRAMMVLGKLGPQAREALPALEKFAADSNPQVAEQARQTLADIREESVTVEEGFQAAPPTASSADDFQIAPPAELPLDEAMPIDPAPIEGGATISVQPPGPMWPSFHGPLRDNLCPETGLLKSWPEGGPPMLWKIEGLGKGFSTVSFAPGMFLTMGDVAPEPGAEERQCVLAYDLDSHQRRWATPIGPPHSDGPRCTPTFDDGRVFALGTDADLVCLNAENGEVLWKKNLQSDFGGQMMSVWKYSESPLIDGEKLICTPGGPDAVVAALDKTTGETLWKAALPDGFGDRGKDGAGYGSPIVAEIDGVRQYLQMLGRGVAAFDAASGEFLWGCNRIANDVANITMPVVEGNLVFATTSYKTGSTLLKVSHGGDGKFAAEEVYFLGPDKFENHHGGVVLVDGYIYGGDGQNQGDPVCLEMKSGKIAWKEKAPERGSAAVLYADGRLIFRYDRGLVVLVEATPKAFNIVGRFTPPLGEGPAWAHPVIFDGKLYLRHGDVLSCFDVKEK